MVTVTCAPRYFVAVIEPGATKSLKKGRIKVMIDISSNSLLRNRIRVVNGSREPVAVYPVDITLNIKGSEVILPAVLNYHEYVTMRYDEARKRCSGTEFRYTCIEKIDKYFKRYLKVKQFPYGEIPPRKKITGFFAFNLPDPFNSTDQSKRVADLLREKKKMTAATITVRVVAVDSGKDLFFNFPVNVITSDDEQNTLLRIMRNY